MNGSQFPFRLSDYILETKGYMYAYVISNTGGGVLVISRYIIPAAA